MSNRQSTIDHVNQILVGIMVSYLFFALLKRTRNPLFSGICNETSITTFECSCPNGWTGVNCEVKVNYCEEVQCLNNGVYQPLFLNYTCECLGTSYSGRHCQITAKIKIIYKRVSKSIVYVTIRFATSVAGFIIIMDVLKYCFGIDPVKYDLEKIPRKKQTKKAKHVPVIQRFVYVNAPLPPPPTTTKQTMSTIV